VEERRTVNRALAEVTDRATDPDRHAWHAAQAASGPVEHVAADLEQSADRARARGGPAAAAAFLERAAALTPEPARQAQRALAAAQASYEAGTPDGALRMLSLAEAGPLNERQRAHVELLRAQIAFAVNRGRDAPPLLLVAAKQLEPLNARLARETYLGALLAALFAGALAVATTCRRRPRPHVPRRPRPSPRARPTSFSTAWRRGSRTGTPRGCRC
jgi:hypothetical protein